MANEPGATTQLDSSFFHIAAMHNALQHLQFAREAGVRREAAAAAELLARRVERGAAEQR